MPKTVAVIGPGDDAQDRDIEDARTLGRLLAERGITVVNGGLGGVMASASEGASSVGGMSIGLLPESSQENANQYLSIAIPTGLGELRNGLVITSADAVVAVGGSWGTLSEIALAKRIGKPIVCLHGWWIESQEHTPIQIDRVETPEAAVNWVMMHLS